MCTLYRRLASLRNCNSVKIGYTALSRTFANRPNDNIMSFEALKSEFQALGGGGNVKLEKDNESGIAVITLENAERRNSITGSMVGRLADIVSELEEWTAGKGLILWGGKDCFCSGADLQQVRQVGLTPLYGHNMCLVMQNVLTRLHQLPMVSVAAIGGKALGGGSELTTACDFRLMAPGGEVQFIQSRMGVVTGWGGGTRLVRLLGARAALDLLLTGRRLDVEGALKLGFADGTVSSTDSLLEEAKSWLMRKTRADTEVVRAVKQIAVQAQLLPLTEALAFERQAFTGVWGGPAQLRALEQNIKHK